MGTEIRAETAVAERGARRELLAREAPVTPVLIGLNVVVFVLMLLSGVPLIGPNLYQLLRWGADFGPLALHGQPWRLLTACFVHIGIIHIGFNMYVLWQVGPFTERLFGSVRYLVLYLLAGLGGSLAGVVIHPLVVSAGASGAIFGVYGGLLAFLMTHRGLINPQGASALMRSAGIFLAYNLVFGLASPHTDLVAHGGGLVTGFLVGWGLSAPLARARRVG